MCRDNKPQLLILTSSFPSSGEDETCGYVRDFARSLVNDFTVRVLTFADWKAGAESEYPFLLTRSRGLSSRFDPLQSGKDLSEFLSAGLFTKLLAGVSLFFFFLRALRLSFQADVICSHWMVPAGLTGALIARLLKKPHVIVEHSGALSLLRKMRGGRVLARFIVNRAARIAVVSLNLQNKLVALCPEAREKIQVIPMGINRHDGLPNPEAGNPIETLPPLKRNRQTIIPNSAPARISKILFIGRLVEIKGLHVLLRALERRRDVQLFVAGEGEKRTELQNLAQQLDVRAVFLGQVGREEKARLFAKCDALVIPSIVLPGGRTEGLPVVALEAMAAGLPVIASRAGGLPEIIADGQNGLLFTAGDHTMLAEKITLLLQDGELRQRLSTNARLAVSPYDWHLIGARYAQLLKGTLQLNDAGEKHYRIGNTSF